MNSRTAASRNRYRQAGLMILIATFLSDTFYSIYFVTEFIFCCIFFIVASFDQHLAFANIIAGQQSSFYIPGLFRTVAVTTFGLNIF